MIIITKMQLSWEQIQIYFLFSQIFRLSEDETRVFLHAHMNKPSW